MLEVSKTEKETTHSHAQGSSALRDFLNYKYLHMKEKMLAIKGGGRPTRLFVISVLKLEQVTEMFF